MIHRDANGTATAISFSMADIEAMEQRDRDRKAKAAARKAAIAANGALPKPAPRVSTQMALPGAGEPKAWEAAARGEGK